MGDLVGYDYIPIDRPPSRFPAGWVILCTVLIVLVVVLSFFFIRQRTQLIDPTRCPVIQGTFGLKAGTTGEALKQCGQDMDEDCLLNVSTLEEAVLQCNMRHDICSHFTHDHATGTMRIINSSQPFSPTNTENMYVRQTS